MIDITKLYYGLSSSGDKIRFHGANQRPVIVWTMTKKCNLNCLHCYSSSGSHIQDEQDPELAESILDRIIKFKPPALLLSGGEPLLRGDFFKLAEHAANSGLKLTLSTNGTMINQKTANKLAEIGFRYVGISIDGPEDVHDHFRGKKGSFHKALLGVENCKKAGLEVGLRLTISKHTSNSIPFIFSLVKTAAIDRVCFYHLHQGGRGKDQLDLELSEDQKKSFMDQLIAETGALLDQGVNAQVLTVGNRYDGIYLYKRMASEDPIKADKILSLLNASKKRVMAGIVNVDSDGTLFMDQFSRDIPMGNILTHDIETMAEKDHSQTETQAKFCDACSWRSLCINSSIYSSKRLEDKICYA